MSPYTNDSSPHHASRTLPLTCRCVLYAQGTKAPTSDRYPFYVVVETGGSCAEHDTTKLHAFLEEAMSAEAAADGVVAQDEQQAKDLWRLREEIAVALASRGAVYKYDVSLPLADMYTLVEVMRERVTSTLGDKAAEAVVVRKQYS